MSKKKSSNSKSKSKPAERVGAVPRSPDDLRSPPGGTPDSAGSPTAERGSSPTGKPVAPMPVAVLESQLERKDKTIKYLEAEVRDLAAEVEAGRAAQEALSKARAELSHLKKRLHAAQDADVLERQLLYTRLAAIAAAAGFVGCMGVLTWSLRARSSSSAA